MTRKLICACLLLLTLATIAQAQPKGYVISARNAEPLATEEDLRARVEFLTDSLCAGRTDDRGYNGDPDGSWGWWLKEGAMMLQTDRPKELLEYLEKSGRRKFAPAQ